MTVGKETMTAITTLVHDSNKAELNESSTFFYFQIHDSKQLIWCIKRYDKIEYVCLL